MILYLIGVDYKSAPLSVRESIYNIRDEIIGFWKSRREDTALLFTCNRIELYGVSSDIFQAARTIDLFRRRFPWIFEKSYVKQGTEEVIEHALRLACGLESQIRGEGEVLEQLNSWISQDSFPWILKKIWKEVLERAEDIRFTSGLRQVNANIAGIIFKDLVKRLSISGSKEVVVIGTGKIAQVLTENRPEGFNLHFASRKKHKRAKQLAGRSGGRAILLDDLPSLLLVTDAAISATSSPHYVLRKEYLSDILKKRKNPLYLYDLAVPRDIEPRAGLIENLFLQDLDDLGPLFKQHAETLDNYVKKAELLILHHIFEIAGGVKERSNVYSY